MDWLPEGWDDILLKVVMSLVIIVIAILAWRVLIKPLFDKGERTLENRSGLTLFKNILRVSIWAWALCAVVGLCFGVDLASVIGALGVVGIAISLGAQQTIANIIGGIIVSFMTTVHIGDWVSVEGGKEGKLIDTNWRCTILEEPSGQLYMVPNSVMVSGVVKKCNPHTSFVVPFALKPMTPDIAGLLRECEQVVFDAQERVGASCEGLRPEAHITGSETGAVLAELKVYVSRDVYPHLVQRDVLPALYDLLQGKDALALMQ